MKYPAYPQYKDSGFEWLGALPEKWMVKKGRYVGQLLGSVTPSETDFIDNEANADEGLPYAKVDDLNQIDGTLVLNRTKARVIGHNPQKGNYLVFPKRGAAIFTNKVAVVQQPMLFDTNLMGWKIYPSFNLKFVAFCLISRRLDDLADVSTVPQINNKHINPAEFPCPPLDEQTAIADFLDRETGRIDTLVAKKRKLVELLKEKRSALISRTVTRGLPANAAREFGLVTGNAAVHEAPGAYGRCRGEKFFAPTEGAGTPEKFKDSGVEWLGEIPVDWVTPPLYSRYSIELGKMLNESKITGKHLLPYLRNIDVQWDSINFIDLPEMDIPEPEYSRYTLKEGDLLVCEGGEVGRSAIVGKLESKIGFQKALHRMRAINSLMECPRYMYYLMYWANKTGVFSSGGISTIAHLTGEQLRKYRFPKPPFQEQTVIAAYLDRETAKIDRLVEKVETAINRLQEYRSALITAAVTGKIDVREA
ncbi:restriction endonuclease subunit S [Methylomonas sp. EFPC3]|uniref:restriction endonuclease subunit S n=1 Tax=Methylomonas sp. EFPC3 TaxID=3021710 RepID=UPI002415B8CD|nr:restriction endonuclease subunit S [Methylomonas sp. EFPC3]WFP49396.1 restriction endonuclease subunit S [Methylomonas sp. EFPC3]